MGYCLDMRNTTKNAAKALALTLLVLATGYAAKAHAPRNTSRPIAAVRS